MMKEIVFDMKFRPEIESGKYKLKCMGHDVEILKWDRRCRDGNCIVGIIKDCEDEYIQVWNNRGEDGNRNTEYNLHLFFDEPAINRFVEALKDTLLEWNDPPEFEVEDSFVKEQANKLYPIAFGEGICKILKELKAAAAQVDANGADHDSLVGLRHNVNSLLEKYMLWMEE